MGNPNTMGGWRKKRSTRGKVQSPGKKDVRDGGKKKKGTQKLRRGITPSARKKKDTQKVENPKKGG